MTPVAALSRLPHAEGLEVPDYATAGSAGFDLRAALEREVTLDPGERALIPTGLCIALPEGFEGQVRPRSGLARDHGVTVLNAPGTIDADYRGEIGVLLINLGADPITLCRGERIAQMVIAPVTQVRFELTHELPPSSRGAGGFGSTGKRF